MRILAHPLKLSMSKKIVITGGPSTGKTTIINRLKSDGFHCFDEISRQVTLEARKKGIDQLFLKDPLQFSKRLLEGRKQQFINANAIYDPFVFLDRGLPDVLAYMDFVGTAYPKSFNEACKTLKYDAVIILKPWFSIYSQDAERYESFEEAKKIHTHLVKTYKRFNYQLITLPEDTVDNRIKFLLESLNL